MFNIRYRNVSTWGIWSWCVEYQTYVKDLWFHVTFQQMTTFYERMNAKLQRHYIFHFVQLSLRNRGQRFLPPMPPLTSWFEKGVSGILYIHTNVYKWPHLKRITCFGPERKRLFKLSIDISCVGLFLVSKRFSLFLSIKMKHTWESVATLRLDEKI